ncbi:MAG: hypothetical protein ACR2QF_03110 [Geminicoccaceae bacterium]
MTPFTFATWYARMYDYHGGVRDCAKDLGVTPEHVRLLRNGKREPSPTLVKLCEALEPPEVKASDYFDGSSPICDGDTVEVQEEGKAPYRFIAKIS